MTRTSLDHFNCSWARTIDVIGDKWTLLIIRDALLGVTTFSGFQRSLGLARNVLTNRLTQLVEQQILQKEPTRPGVDRYHYRLTDRGKELLTIMVAMGQWGDKWLFSEKGAPVEVVDRATKHTISPVSVTSADGRTLRLSDVTYRPGPGANEATLRAFDRALKKQAPPE